MVLVPDRCKDGNEGARERKKRRAGRSVLGIANRRPLNLL